MTSPVSDLLVRRALALFEREPSRRWTVESLAEALGVSRAVLARRFEAAVQRPPMRALTEVRMRRARELLRDTDGGLASIADAVGYDSEFAFSRAFKRHEGVAPAIYRRSVRGSGSPVCMAA